jgi:hypothetical protein
VAVWFVLLLLDVDKKSRPEIVMTKLVDVCNYDMDMCADFLTEALVLVSLTSRTPGPVVDLLRHQNDISACTRDIYTASKSLKNTWIKKELWLSITISSGYQSRRFNKYNHWPNGLVKGTPYSDVMCQRTSLVINPLRRGNGDRLEPVYRILQNILTNPANTDCILLAAVVHVGEIIE